MTKTPKTPSPIEAWIEDGKLYVEIATPARETLATVALDYAAAETFAKRVAMLTAGLYAKENAVDLVRGFFGRVGGRRKKRDAE